MRNVNERSAILDLYKVQDGDLGTSSIIKTDNSNFREQKLINSEEKSADLHKNEIIDSVNSGDDGSEALRSQQVSMDMIEEEKPCHDFGLRSRKDSYCTKSDQNDRVATKKDSDAMHSLRSGLRTSEH